MVSRLTENGLRHTVMDFRLTVMTLGWSVSLGWYRLVPPTFLGSDAPPDPRGRKYGVSGISDRNGARTYVRSWQMNVNVNVRELPELDLTLLECRSLLSDVARARYM